MKVYSKAAYKRITTVRSFVCSIQMEDRVKRMSKLAQSHPGLPSCFIVIKILETFFTCHTDLLMTWWRMPWLADWLAGWLARPDTAAIRDLYETGVEENL